VHDVAVIGGGPAGIAAAATAAEGGLRVVLIDAGARPGGQIWRHVSRHSLPRTARRWLHRLERSDAFVRSATSVVDITPAADGFAVRVHAEADGVAETIRARMLVLAAGARERFLPFPGWTLPGVFGAGGGQALLKAGAAVKDARVIVAGSGPLLLPVAAAFSAAGARVTHVIEQAPATRVARFALGLWRNPSRAAQAASWRVRSLHARYLTGAWVSAAEGSGSVSSVQINDGRRVRREPCDLLCVGYGLVPANETAQLLGCELDGAAVRVDARQQTTLDRVYCAGESTGVAGVHCAVLEGVVAARAIIQRFRDERIRDERLHDERIRDARIRDERSGDPDARAIAKERAFAARMDVAFELRPEVRSLARPDTIVCRCEDVMLGAIARCESLREAKLHTRAGMGPCQGRVCGPAIELLFNWEAGSVRPPIVPAPVSTLLNETETIMRQETSEYAAE
jgi:NADPH-dependent 2,4-dienoyl-CoA reductase/sulfur reductase-like enzyme